MDNYELQEKAIQAASRFFERKDFESLEVGWTSFEGATLTWSAETRTPWFLTPPPSSTARAARPPAATLRLPRLLAGKQFVRGRCAGPLRHHRHAGW